MPSFKSDEERTAWIQAHADCYTVVRFRNRKYERVEAPTLAEAIQAAERIVAQDPSARLLVYAVSGALSCYVTTVKKE